MIYTIQVKDEYEDGARLDLATRDFSTVEKKVSELAKYHDGKERTLVVSAWHNDEEVAYRYSCSTYAIYPEQETTNFDVENLLEVIGTRLKKEANVRYAEKEVARLEADLLDALKTLREMRSG